jgi:hypothetical protein
MPQFHQSFHEQKASGFIWLMVLMISGTFGIVAYIVGPWFRSQSVGPLGEAFLLTVLGEMPVFLIIAEKTARTNPSEQYPRLIVPRPEWPFTAAALTDLAEAVLVLGLLFGSAYGGSLFHN